MRGFWTLTVTEAKLFTREPAAAFFTLIFPLMLLFVFGSIFGNDPSAELDGRGSVDSSVPGYMALIIATTGLLGLPLVLANYREQGILRRLRATPVRPLTVLGAHIAVQLAMTIIGVTLLIIAGRIVYGLQWPRAPATTVLAFLLASLSFYAAGFVLASLLPTPRVAETVGQAIYFPMLFLSGATFPRQMMPDTVRALAEALPMTHIVILLSDLWFGEGWAWVSAAVLAGLLVAGVAVSARTFRWE
ncbi:MAG: ABC transporter permease [Thermomicrobiales bacterium]